MADHFFNKMKESIQPNWWTAFISTFVIGLCTHFYVFTNRLPNHDGMYNIYSSQAKVTSGRFFLGPASGFSSYFDLPWVIGLFSLFFLALTAVCVVVLLNVQQKLPIILIAGIVVAFPSVSSTFAYMFTADGYMLGTFLTLFGIVLTKRYQYGFVIGALTLLLGVGIYQANISVALGFITISLISQILFKEGNGKQLGGAFLRYGLMFLTGMGLYAVVYKVYTSFFQGKITSYQGLDKVGQVSWSDFPDRYEDIKDSFNEFFFHSIHAYQQYNFHEMLNIAVLSVIGLCMIFWIIRNKLYLQPIQLVIMLLLIVTLPFSYYIVYFISLEAEYHMLMVFSLSTVYIFLAVLLDRLPLSDLRWINYTVSGSVAGLLTATIVNFALIANIAYMNMELRYEKSMHLANRILDRIEQLEGYHEIEKIGVVGRATLHAPLTAEIIPKRIPRMVGTTGESFLAEADHYRKAFENYFGYTVVATEPEEMEAIKQSEEFISMPIWPAEGSIRQFDNIVIIKFTE